MKGLLPEARLKSYNDYRREFYESADFLSDNNYPIHLDFELTNLCNYKCEFCVQGLINKPEFYKKKKELPKSLVFEALTHAKEIGVRSVQFNGQDEPTLYKELVEVLEFASSLKFDDIFFNTNGSKLTEQLSTAIIKSGITKIQISVDAYSPETYLAVRKSKDYDKVVQNILRLIEIRSSLGLKLPLIRVSFVESELNCHETDDFVNFWESKVDIVAIQKLINIHKFANRHNSDMRKNVRCNMPNFRLMIKADGSTRPCCTAFGDELISLGNISEVSIADIWRSPAASSFRALHKDGEWHKNSVCKKCIESTQI
jgi:MoaA/NifB/PqqE/SkfB family radical SAM enzyme